MYYKTHCYSRAATAFSMVEVLIAVALMGVLAILSVKLVLNSPKDVWPRTTEDYFRQISAIYSKIKLENGDSPLNAIDNSTINNPTPTPLYTDGMATLLSGNNVVPARPWDTGTTYTARNGGSSTPGSLLYPSKLTLYLDPEDTNITDTNNQLPRHQAGALTPDNPVTSTSPQSIMANTNDREWLMLDVNGSDPPNSLSSDGDRVLLIVDDSTGRVLTAWQKCWMQLKQSTTASPIANPYGAGTTCVMGPATTPAFATPARTYYKSFYDVYKNYTGPF